MIEILKSKMMVATAVILLGIIFIGSYAQKNDLSSTNETSQIEILNKFLLNYSTRKGKKQRELFVYERYQ